MQSSKTPGKGDALSKRSSTTTEKSIPRGLASASNGAGASSSKKTNGESRGEADSYYGTSSAHPLTSSYPATNGGAHDASVYSATNPGGGGVSGVYNPTFQPTYSNLGTNTIGTGVSAAIPIPNPPASASQYNPVPVPQESPFYPSTAAAFAGTATSISNNSHAVLYDASHATGESASYYGNPQTETSVASVGHSGLSHSLGSSISAVAGTIHANHNHNHNHPPPPLRQSFRKLWESFREEERHEVGQFELYSEVIGVCAECFTPGTSYIQAPRTHHYGQRWSKTKKVWRVRKSKSRRVWMRIFRKNDVSDFTSSSSTSNSSSSDSTSSISDSDLSDTTLKRRRLVKKIRRERKELKRQERQELMEQNHRSTGRRQSNSSSIIAGTGSAAYVTWKDVSGSSAGESNHRYTKTSMTYSAPGVLRGGDLAKSKDQAVFYNPGYGPDGKAHPTYYSESTPHGANKTSNRSVLTGLFGSSRKAKKSSKYKRNGSRTSVVSSGTSMPGQLFEVSSSSSTASEDGLIYSRGSSSPGSLGSGRKGWWVFGSVKDKKGNGKGKRSGKKGKSSYSSSSSDSKSSSLSFSEDGLVYDSRGGTSLGSASIRSKKSYTGSVAGSFRSVRSRISGVFGIGKLQRRKSWSDYGRTSGSATIGLKRSSTTGGSRSWASTKGAAPVADVASATTSGLARKKDSCSSTAITSGSWASGSASMGSHSGTSWQEGLENDKQREPYVYDIEVGETRSSSAVSSTLVGIRSHSTADVTSSILKNKDKETRAQRQDSDSQVFVTLPSGERKSTKEVWIQDTRRERSLDRFNVPAGKSKKGSSVDDWESIDTRQSHQKTQKAQKASITSKTGIFGRLFSGQSVRDQSSSRSKGDYDVTIPQGEPVKLTKATNDPTRFEATRSPSETNLTRQQSDTSSFVQESRTSEQQYNEQERQSSSRTHTATTVTKTQTTGGGGMKVAEGGFPSLAGSVEQQRGPLPVPTQSNLPAQSVPLPVATSTTTIINNHNITHNHTTSNTSNNSTSISNVTHNVAAVVPSPVQVHPVSSSVVEQGRSGLSTVEYSDKLVQDVAAQVMSVYEKERTEREERERREIISRERRDKSEKERSEMIQKELMMLREREEKAALMYKEKNEREEKERRALRVAIELKEKEELELKLKREREERVAIELKKRAEWEVREREKDEAARLARQKQDEERFEQIKAEEERKYREWCRQETLRRQQREREEEIRYQNTRKEKVRQLEEHAVIQKEEAEAIEVKKRMDIKEELQLSKQKEQESEKRRFDASIVLGEETRKVQKLEEKKRAYVEAASQSFSAGVQLQQKKDTYVQVASQGQQSSIEVQRMEFQKEQDRFAQQARTVEDTRRVQFEYQLHSNKREQKIIETEHAEISQEYHKTTEKLSKLEQVASEARRSRDESRFREVQQQIRIEKEKESRLRVEEEKKGTAVAELRRQEDVRVRELEMQIADEKERDTAAIIKGQEIVATEAEAKRWQHDKKVQQLSSQISIDKDKEGKLKKVEEKRVLDQMEQTRLKDEKTREYIAQIQTEEKSMQVQVEQQKVVQVQSEFKCRQESQDLMKQVASEEERVELRKADQEQGQVETRREKLIGAGQSMTVPEEQMQALKREGPTNEAATELQLKVGEDMTEEQRIIQAEVRRRWDNELKEQKRIELERQLAEIQQKIAEQKKMQEGRARRRARKAEPEYKEREARRSRERSKVRENEAEKARREEIEYIRKNAGLDSDKAGKKVSKKSRYTTSDPLPTGDIPGFIERSWSVPNGVPRLVETPPTPPPGTSRPSQRIYCEGSYFPRVPAEVDSNIPVIPTIPQMYVAEPETFAETSVEFERRMQQDTSVSASRTEATHSLTSSGFETTAGSSGEFERSVTSSEFERKTEKYSEIERSSEITGAGSSVTTEQSVASVEGAQAASGSRWGSFGFGSGLARAVTQAISDAPSIVTGKPFSGAPVAPVPTVPNLGAAVIDYKQKSDSQQYEQINPQQQQQELQYYGPQLPPNFSFKESVYQDSTTSESQSQSIYEQTSSNYSRQQANKTALSNVEYGPTPQQIAYGRGTTISSDLRSEPSYQHPASDYSRSKTSSQIVSTSVLPQVQASHQSTSDGSTRSFRIPGAFDDEEVPPEVIPPVPRNSQSSSVVPIYHPVMEIGSRSVSESAKDIYSGSTSYSTEFASKSGSIVSREGQTSSVSTHRSALTDDNRSISESAKSTFSSESTSKFASTLSKEICLEETSSSAPISRPAITGDKHAFSESTTALYSAELETRSTSSLSRDQDFQTPPTHESTPVQSVPSYRQQPSSPNVNAFVDEEASSAITQTPRASRIVGDDGKSLTRAQIDKDNDLMAVAAASAEQAGFSVDLVLAGLNRHRLSTVIESGETTPTGRRPSIARPRSAFMEEVEDEDSPKIKRQLGQYELSPEAYLSQAEALAREEARSRSEQKLVEHSVKQPIPNPVYSSTPAAPELRLTHVPLPQSTLSSAISAPAGFSSAHSAPPSPATVQGRNGQSHGVSRTVPASRSSSASGSSRTMVQDDSQWPSSALRSSSVSGIFRSQMDSSRRDSSAVGPTESLHSNAPSFSDSGIGLDSARGRVPRSEEEEAEFMRAKRQREKEEIGAGNRGRRERSAEPRQPFQRRSTEQWSGGQSLDRQSLPRRSTEQWTAERQPLEDYQFPRRSTDSTLMSHEQQPTERHSRRSIDSVRRLQESYVPAEGTDINEVEGKTEAESPSKARSKMQKVTNLGKMFSGWRSRSKSGSRSREASQTRAESVKSLHKRSVSEASGVKERPTDLTRHNTEEWEQVAVTPPQQKSRAASLRDQELDLSYERVENDNTSSPPMIPHDEPDSYPFEEAEESRRNFDASIAQDMEVSISQPTSLETTASPETPERPKSERKLSTKSGFSGILKAARQFRKGSQTPPRVSTEESSRVDTDRKESRPSSSAGVSLYHDDAREEQSYTENTWAYSARGDAGEQGVVENVSLPTSTVEEREPSNSRLPLSRSLSLKRKSTKSLRKESEAGESQSGGGGWSQTTAEGREEGDERGSDSISGLPIKKSKSLDRKVKQTANSHTYYQHEEPVAKSYNCVGKSTSAMMLTLSEGVDLSSDVKGQQEDKTPLFEPLDIFDDRDSPQSYENLPLEPFNSPLYSPTQQRNPDTISFVSRTYSPVLKSPAVDIYEEYPALPKTDPSSPNSLHLLSLNAQSTTPELVQLQDGEFPSLPPSGHSTYVQPPVTEHVEPEMQAETQQSPFISFQNPSPHNFPINVVGGPSMPGFSKATSEDRSVSPQEVSASPVIEVQPLSPIPLNEPSTHGVVDTFEDILSLQKTGQLTPTIEEQEPSIIFSTPNVYPAPTENYSPTTVDWAASPTTEAQLGTSTSLAGSEPVHDERSGNMTPAVDRYTPLPVTESQGSIEGSIEGAILEEMGYHSSNTFVEAPEDPQALPHLPTEPQKPVVERQPSERATTHIEGDPQSLDPALNMLESLPGSPLEELKLAQEILPLSDMSNVHKFAPSESIDQPYAQVQSTFSLGGRYSPHLSEPAPENSQYISQKESSPHTSQTEKEAAQQQLQLDTDIAYPGMDNLPELPPSHSSPVLVSPVLDESSSTVNDPFVSQLPSEPASPITVPVHGVSTSPPSGSVSPRSQEEIETNESIIENFPLTSKPLSPQLPKPLYSSPETTDGPTTLVKPPNLPLNGSLPTYLTFKEPTRPVDSRSPTIAAEESTTGASLSKPASPMLATIPDNLPQLSEPSPVYHLSDDLYQIPDIPERDHTSLSPILEEVSESAISRPSSAAAEERPSVAMPDISMAPYGPSGLHHGGSLVLELPHEDSFESRQVDVATLAGTTSTVKVAMVPDNLPQGSLAPTLELPIDQPLKDQSPVKNEVELEVDITPSTIEDTTPNHLSKITQGEPPITDLEVQLDQSCQAPSSTVQPELAPEAYSTSPVSLLLTSTNTPSSPIGEDTPGFSLEQPIGYGVQESQASGSAKENSPPHEPEVQLDTGCSSIEVSPSNGDILPEPASVSLPEVEETWSYSPAVEVESPVEIREANVEQGISGPTPEYTLSTEANLQPTSRRSSVDGAQLSPTMEVAEDLEEPEHIPLSEEFQTSVLGPISRRASQDVLQLSPIMEAAEESELESLPLPEGVSAPTSEQPAMTELPEADLGASTNDMSQESAFPEYTFPIEAEQESISRHISEGNVQLSPILEISEWPEGLPPPGDISTPLPSVPTEPLATELTTRWLPIENSLLPSLSMGSENTIPEQSLVLHGDILPYSSPTLAEPAEFSIEAANEISFSLVPTEAPENPMESTVEPAIGIQQVEEEQAKSQSIYDMPPRAEIEPIIQNTEVESSKSVEISGSIADNDLEIDGKPTGGGGQDGEKGQVEDNAEARGTTTPSPQTVASVEEAFVQGSEDRRQSLDTENIFFKSIVPADIEEADTWEQGVKLEAPTRTEEEYMSNVEVELISKKATSETAHEQTPEEYETSIVKPSSLIPDKPDFYTPSVDPTALLDTEAEIDKTVNTGLESQCDVLVEDEDDEQEGVVLELPRVTEQELSSEGFVLNKEKRGEKAENAAPRNEDEKVLAQHEATAALEQVKQPGSQAEYPTAAIEPMQFTEAKSEVEETAVAKSVSKKHVQDGGQASSQVEEAIGSLTLIEERLFKDEGPVTREEADQHKDILEAVSDQEPPKTRPESPEFEKSVYWSDFSPPDPLLPETNLKPLEEEPRSEPQQDTPIEHEYFGGQTPDQPGPSAIVPASPTIQQKTAELEVPLPPSELAPLPETGYAGEHSENIEEAPWLTTDIPEEEDAKQRFSTDADSTSIAPSQLEEPAYQSRPPTPQTGPPLGEPSRSASPNMVGGEIKKYNEEKEQLPALPGSPVHTPRKFSQEQTSNEEPQRDHVATPVLIVESDIEQYPSLPPSQAPAHTIPGPSIEEQSTDDDENGAPLVAIQNQEDIHQVLPSTEVLYQIPSESKDSILAIEAVEPTHPGDVPTTTSVDGEVLPSISHIAATVTLPQEGTAKKSEFAGENQAPEYESVPIQPTPSGGSRKKSKKARQREKKRRSLKGIDISGPSTAGAETVHTPSMEENQSENSTLTRPVQNDSNRSPVTAGEATLSMVSSSGSTEVNLAGDAEGSGRRRVTECANKDLAQEDRLPETCFPEAQRPPSYGCELRVTGESKSLATIKSAEKEEQNQESGESTALPVISPLSLRVAQEVVESVKKPTTNKLPRSPSPVTQLEATEPDVLEEEVKKEMDAVLSLLPPTQQTTPALPSLETAVSNVEDLPNAPISQLPLLQGTPNIVVDPPSETTILKSPGSHSTRKVDVGHLRLPPNIPQDEGLPTPLHKLIDNEYTGGVSLQSGPETPTMDDPEDEDPRLSSFGNETIQATQIAQVGLRNPMLSDGSRLQKFLGVMGSPSQRTSTQEGDSNESVHDHSTPEEKNQRVSTPSIEGDSQVEDDEKEKEGEEGIERGGNRGSYEIAVNTAIENEAAQSDRIAIQIPLSNIRIPVLSEEAAPVSKEKTTKTYHTVNAEDLLSQTSTNKPIPTIELPHLFSVPSNNLPSEIYIPTETRKNSPTKLLQSTISLEQTPSPTLTKPFPISQGESPQLPPIAKTPSIPSVFLENLSQLREEYSISTQPQAEDQRLLGENANLPSSEASITPPPLTHSSSFESAIEFWKRRISIPAATDLILSPELSPYATHSESGVSLPVSTLPKSRTPSAQSRPQSRQASKPLDREAKAPSPGPDTTTSQAQSDLGISYQGSFSGQDPAPSIAGNSSSSNSLSNLASDLEILVEADPSYQVSVRKASDENKPRRNIIEISLQKPGSFTTQELGRLSRRETQNSCDSYPGKPPAEVVQEPDTIGSPTVFAHLAKPNLPTATEHKPEEATKKTPTQPVSTNERSFISADDLLARLPARRLASVPSQSNVTQKTKVPSDKKMDILKRGERRHPTLPSLRRAGSQLESPNASSEHIIFGGGHQTQDSPGKTLRKADLYEAWGDKAGEPKSPTRPPSIRRRQSMQIVDLENRLEGLAAENTILTHEKANIEKALSESIQRHKSDTAIFTQEIESGKVLLTEKDSEITELKKKLDYYRQEVSRLSHANDSLASTNTSLSTSYKFSYGALAGKYERKREQLANLSKEHSELQASFSEVQATMENVIRNQLQEKDSELDRLRNELAKAREEVQKLQHQVETRQDNKYLDTKDLDHFSSSCQKLYGSLKTWCNQFSSFSTGKKCVHVHRLKDEAVRDRVEDVMLDDRGVRRMLKDEKRRSEVFMAITMRMLWEHVFTRYLFGLEIDERQKLLSLEKTLAEVGEHEAVHQWRATTLTLLSTRPTIKTKRIADAEEIIHTILNLLNFLLPPPSQYNSLALESLRNLVQYAVQLAVEMRTQRAEYVMKRPPRPEYDDSGEVTNSVPFIASSMQNRGTELVSDRELESEGATVKLVLFPQVIRRGNEYGEDYGIEVTVLPMQVLVNRPQLKSESRAPNKSAGSIWRDQQSQGRGVSRLTPIADHSPGETPRTTPEKAKITAPNMLPMIPEQTIRLVQEDAAARAYPSPSSEKRRRLDDQ